jgi:hypothetical protein
MKRLLKLAIASIMVVGAISVSAQTQTEYEEVRAKIESYETLSILKENGHKSFMRAGADKNIIRRGDTVRFKVLWNINAEYTNFKGVYVEGVGQATPEDMRKGEFEVVLKPEKTTTYKWSCVYIMNINHLERSVKKEHDFTIVVLEPEKYDSVMQLRSSMNSQQKDLHFSELKGEKVDPREKEIINKMAKMSPKERREYEKELERKYSNKRR